MNAKTIGLVGLFLLLCAAFLVVEHSYVVVPPDTQKQSKFFRVYNPAVFLNSLPGSCSLAWGTSASAGLLFFNRGHNVKFERTLEPELCGRYQYSAILTAIHQSVLSALGSAGCQVPSDQLTADQGIQIVYRCGNRTAGLVTAGPPKRRPGNIDGPFFLTLKFSEEWLVRS